MSSQYPTLEESVARATVEVARALRDAVVELNRQVDEINAEIAAVQEQLAELGVRVARLGVLADAGPIADSSLAASVHNLQHEAIRHGWYLGHSVKVEPVGCGETCGETNGRGAWCLREHGHDGVHLYGDV